MSLPDKPQPVFVRISDAKTYFGVHKNTMYRWAAAGAFEIYKRGEISLVKVSEVEAYITGGAATGAAA